MEELVNFLNANEIKKKELADFLGISVQFLGQILRGERKLPYDKLKQIKANDRDWRTDMLPDAHIVQTIGNHSPYASNNYNHTELVENLRSQIANLQEIIRNKDTQIDRLIKLLENK